MQIAFPQTPPEELAEFLTRDFVMEGTLWKTGPGAKDAYRKRYFVLDDRKLMYLNDPLVSKFVLVHSCALLGSKELVCKKSSL